VIYLLFIQHYSQFKFDVLLSSHTVITKTLQYII